MGVVLSVLGMTFGAVAVGIFCSMAANAARESKWKSAEMWAGIAGGAALLMAVISLFVVLYSRSTVVGEIVGALTLAAPGVNISFIFLLLTMIGVTVMETFSFIYSVKEDKSKAEGLSVGGAIVSFAAVIMVPILIVLLL
jgi:hypothetical protein